MERVNSLGDEREMGRLEAKVDMLIESVKLLTESLKKDYVPRTELEQRLNKLENAPNKWMANGISILSLLVAAWAIYH